MKPPPETQCRVCGSARLVPAGHVEYFQGYDWPVWDCAACGCRLTRHDPVVHDRFHASGAISYYSDYRVLAATCQALFAAGRRDDLRATLARTAKYQFIIEKLGPPDRSLKVLEIGCARGFLTSCFILDGWNITGVDVSPEAVNAAKAAFGDHFVLDTDPALAAGAVYDVIYHVGMIGCVSDPLGLTRDLLARLRPGGRLLFNAPNRGALHLRGQVWLDSAPPPDLVTLFPEGFWRQHFGECAVVTERVETVPPVKATELGLRSLLLRRWQPPEAKPLAPAGAQGHAWSQTAGPLGAFIERAALKVARTTGLTALAPHRPTDFGLFVEMTKR